MRYTEKTPLVIGEPGGKSQHVMATGTAMGYDMDLYEEGFVSGKGAAELIKSGLFVLVDDGVERTVPATAEQVTFDTPGPSAEVAAPVVPANPTLATDPTEGGDKRAKARQAQAAKAAPESRTESGAARTVEHTTSSPD